MRPYTEEESRKKDAIMAETVDKLSFLWQYQPLTTEDTEIIAGNFLRLLDLRNDNC